MVQRFIYMGAEGGGPGSIPSNFSKIGYNLGDQSSAPEWIPLLWQWML